MGLYSAYIAISKNKKTKMKTSNANFSSMLYSAQSLLQTINDLRANELMTYGNNIYTNEDGKKLEKKEKVFFEDTCPYYEILKTYIMTIIERKELYLTNEFLTQDDFDSLQGFLYLIDEMITYCLNKEIDYVLDYKRDFFERLINLGEMVLIDIDSSFQITLFEIDE